MAKSRVSGLWMSAASAFLIAASTIAPALADDQPQPQRGSAPGASTGLGDTPIVGAGANGNGGVMQTTPGEGKEQKGSTPTKADQPQLSK